MKKSHFHYLSQRWYLLFLDKPTLKLPLLLIKRLILTRFPQAELRLRCEGRDNSRRQLQPLPERPSCPRFPTQPACGAGYHPNPKPHTQPPPSRPRPGSPPTLRPFFFPPLHRPLWPPRRGGPWRPLEPLQPLGRTRRLNSKRAASRLLPPCN